HGVRTFQAEDEIAAVCSAIGASFAGHMAITTSSGPGIALKGEAMGLGMILELPMLIINVQRGGPSTGLPTKTEQSDLYQAMFGRNGESPLPVVAPQSPSDCFAMAIDAWRIAATFMCPGIILSDGYIANGAEPWKIPDFDSLEKIEITHPAPREDGDPAFLPYARDENLARPWALPGTKGLEHRIGGLEKAAETGNVSYDPDNHQAMCELRQEKIDRIADFIPPQEVFGPEKGDLLVLSWGGTYGACRTAVTHAQAAGASVAHAQLRYLNPFPSNFEEILNNYDKVLIPELNLGQLKTLIQAKYLIECVGLNKVKGRPFAIVEIEQRIAELTR
ncbi:MAG: 2-oxoglutarate ferredoxin oxidoreductase subunit alpha, partial [Planctomycetaceae bacterium]|nr:2-oxoglutarate ferredoxin oxidoreductase subunit alpha [Planctomycetaceae bacterium]